MSVLLLAPSDALNPLNLADPAVFSFLAWFLIWTAAQFLMLLLGMEWIWPDAAATEFYGARDVGHRQGARAASEEPR